MFNNATKVRASITETDPVFKARYLGCVETFVASGPGCTIRHVQTLWDNAGAEKHMKKVTLVLNTDGILMKDDSKKKDKEIHFAIENVSFCNADSNIERVFCWVCKEEDSTKLLCHAVLCSSKDNAKTMAVVMSRAFQIAYKEWKTIKSREIRESRKGKLPDQILQKQKSKESRTDSASQDTDSLNGSEQGSESGSTENSKGISNSKDSQSQIDIDNVSSILQSSVALNGVHGQDFEDNDQPAMRDSSIQVNVDK